jgi:hypothetical protein
MVICGALRKKSIHGKNTQKNQQKRLAEDEFGKAFLLCCIP